MGLFTSARERRLWLWTAAVMVAIYSTLGPARTLVGVLRERDLLEISFALVVAAVVAAVSVRWAKRRPGWPEIGVALGVAFAYLVAFARIGSPEERTHLIEYGVVAALIHQALLERARNGRPVPAPAALAVTVTALLGVLDEGIQALLPGRVFDPRDIFFNAFAGAMVVLARLAMVPPSRPGWRVWFLWLVGTAVGWGLGVEWGAFAEPGGLRTLRSAPAVIWAGYLGVVAAGILAAGLQWLVLRGKVVGAGWWVPATVGAAAAIGVLIVSVGTIDRDLGWVAGAALYGTAAGVMQWLVMREQIPRAGWWVLASAAGWVAGMPLEEFGWLAVGAAHGATTGAALVWLLRQAAPAPHGAPPPR